MVMGAGLMVQFVLLVLFLFSVASWAIIIYKLRFLKKAEDETAAFSELFWRKKNFKEIHAALKEFRHTPLAPIFDALYAELASTRPGNEGQTNALSRDDIDRLRRVLTKACAAQSARLEYGVPFLATSGSAAPFIGLFGTVWGIMNSFRGIGAKGAASLAVVAPGISEALIATAMGLAAAIPASIGYNHLVTRLGRINTEMEGFTSDILNIIEKQLPRA